MTNKKFLFNRPSTGMLVQWSVFCTAHNCIVPVEGQLNRNQFGSKQPAQGLSLGAW